LRRSSLLPKMLSIYWRRGTRRGRLDKQTGCVYHIRFKHDANFQNERSSRSHSVFTIVIESKPRDGNGDDDVRLSRLTLIVRTPVLPSERGADAQDLAGSEKAVSDLERRGEGKHINRRYVRSLLYITSTDHQSPRAQDRHQQAHRQEEVSCFVSLTNCADTIVATFLTVTPS
jgi:hypothetical protein